MIYLVSQGSYEDYRILGIFKTHAEAVRFICSMPDIENQVYDLPDIEKRKLDSFNKVPLLKPYRIKLSFFNEAPTILSIEDISTEYGAEPIITIAEYYFVTVTCFAINKEAAGNKALYITRDMHTRPEDDKARVEYETLPGADSGNVHIRLKNQP